jgi:LysM repeat protein
MRPKIKPSEIILVVVSVATACGALLVALVFLSAMAGRLSISTSRPALAPTPGPMSATVNHVQTPGFRGEELAWATEPPTVQIDKPTATQTPLPTLYTFVELTSEVPSFPAVILPTEMSASSLPTSVVPEPQAQTVTHVIRPNENLYRIAQQYDVSVNAIIELNSLVRPRVINPGRTILIPNQEHQSLAEALPTVPSPAVTLEATPPPTATPESAILPTSMPETVTEAAAAPEPIAPTTLPEPTELPPEPSTPLYSINGLPLDSIAVMPPDVRQHVREIYALGQSLGANSHSFSKVGDSTSGHPYFLAHFDGDSYELGPYGYLQPAINHFSGSYTRKSVANRVGLHSWTATDPAWASNTICLPNESPIACEIRLHRPIIILIRLGSNDRGASGLFDSNMRLAVQIALDNGVIPVLGTKPDRFEGSGNVNNIMIRQIAADFRIPLWELDLAAATIPGRGLGTDNVHLTSLYPYDYGLSWALQRGHAVQNISALMILHTILEELNLLSG